MSIVRLAWLMVLAAVIPLPFCQAQTPPPGVPARSTNLVRLKHKSFTFVRVQYDTWRGDSRWRRNGSWATDYPDADLNFSKQLAEVTGLKTDPKGLALRLTDTNLVRHPFLYISEGGMMQLAETEQAALRSYLRGGGFLMIDDFWGENEWLNVKTEMKKVLPDVEPVDLPLTHPIFHSFYEMKEKPQVPSVIVGMQSEKTGVTWERPDAKGAKYWGLMNAQGRLMALLCQNTDLADGWERLTESPFYRREFSEKRAFPMGINIVIHALSQ